MKEQTICPFCKSSLKTKLIVDFYFCKECEVAVRNEINMPLSWKNIFDKNWVKTQDNEKVNIRKAFYVLKQVKRLGIRNKILDVGCGTGILVDILNRNGYITNGVDSSSDAIEFAKLHKKGNFYLSSLESFSNDNKYALVIATQLIEHLANPNVFLESAKKLLKPGGYLYIETPNLYSWNKRSIWRKRIGGMYGKDHRILYTSKSLARLIKDSNFDIYKLFTWTYSPTIFVEGIKTLFSIFRKKTKIQNELVVINQTSNKPKSVLKNIYRQFKSSFIINTLLFIPNKISEFNNRGNQLIVIAEFSTQQSKTD